MRKKKKIRIADLFCWIGGFHLAFQNLWAECVFASDIDIHARKTYEANHRKHSEGLFKSGNFVGDISIVPSDKIPDLDILCGGFPCQPFSQSGYKRWFEDPGRWNLFFDIVRILKDKRPKAFFLENVRHLINHDDGKTLATIKSLVCELGYSLDWRVVKASEFWLPQHRPRVFFVGFDKNLLAPNSPGFEFPEPVPLKLNMSDIFWATCSREVGFTLRVWWRWSSLTDRRNWDNYLVEWKPRRLTSKEGRAMMWFPADFIFPVSETQAMKQLWNSVAVPAIRATAEAIIKYISKHMSDHE